MLLLKVIKRKLGLSKPFVMPNPLIPWDIFADIDPKKFRAYYKEQRLWIKCIWMPYWASLPNKERVAIKRQAPSQDWLDFIERFESRIPKMREYFQNTGAPFNHNYYLDSFIKDYTRLNT